MAIRGPFGRPWDLDALHGDVVIAAGGIGLAPLRSAVYALLDTVQERPDRRIVLVVGARHSADLLYAGHYDDWRARGLEVVTTIDTAEAGWPGRVGLGARRRRRPRRRLVERRRRWSAVPTS